MERHVLDEIIMGTATLADLMSAGDVVLRGDADVVRELFGLLDTFELWFNIVEP
jgi:alkyl sulfatase BDS1-like metallo-beta-lactamase superfamily hydrolase